MESEKIYEESHKELLKLKRNIGTDQIIINMKLHEKKKKNRINTELSKIISERSKEIERVILGVK